jgi:hypothetical protein
LEELLFTEEPLRPHSIKTKLNNMEEIDTKFVPYDYTNPNKRNNSQEILTQSTTESTTTTTSIFKKVGGAIHEKIDQAKYSSQGYYELSEQ